MNTDNNTNENTNHPDAPADLNPRVAYVLGEATEAEVANIKSRTQSDPIIQREITELQHLAAAAILEVRTTPALKASDSMRQAIDQRLGEIETETKISLAPKTDSRRRRNRRLWLAFIGGSLCVVGIALAPVFNSTSRPRNVTQNDLNSSFSVANAVKSLPTKDASKNSRSTSYDPGISITTSTSSNPSLGGRGATSRGFGTITKSASLPAHPEVVQDALSDPAATRPQSNPSALGNAPVDHGKTSNNLELESVLEKNPTMAKPTGNPNQPSPVLSNESLFAEQRLGKLGDPKENFQKPVASTPLNTSEPGYKIELPNTRPVAGAGFGGGGAGYGASSATAGKDESSIKIAGQSRPPESLTESPNHYYRTLHPSAPGTLAPSPEGLPKLGWRNVELERDGRLGQFELHDKPASPNAEQYRPITDNPFRIPDGEQALSTFSVDVDTASYANVRRFLQNGQLPPPDAVRIEELLNYFSYQYPQPTDEHPFAVNMETAACPWNGEHRLVRIGIKGKEIAKEKRPASNLVFLIDVSGSMSSDDKLPLLKKGLSLLVKELTEDDRVSIITYAGDAGEKLSPTNGSDKQKILAAIEALNAGGSTNGSAGIHLAYEKAKENFIAGGTNRVLWATDGDLNVGVTGDAELVALVKEKAQSGVFVSVLGFGTGNLKDGKLEQIADNGNGIYAYVDSLREARKVLVEQMSGSLITIAKDVKLQVEFNPAEVASYRLVGYENRVLATQDFNNDKKDAGDIGAGHTVTALYELVPTAPIASPPEKKLELKYQKPTTAVPAAPNQSELKPTAEATGSGELLTLKLRYKKPTEDHSQLLEMALKNNSQRFTAASADFQFASAVASFGMLLRHSPHRGAATFDQIIETASATLSVDPSGYRAEFVDLVRKAKEIAR